MNKHGFIGVRKRNDGRAKPYYARFRLNGECLYTKSHECAEAAAKEYEKYAAARMTADPGTPMTSPVRCPIPFERGQK